MAVPDSIEHKTLMTYLDKLAIAFRSSLPTVAKQLVDQAVIPAEIHRYVVTEGTDDSHTKATTMMMCVADQVQVCPGKYYDFMSMSVFEQAWIKSLRDDLTSEYEKLKAAAASQKGKVKVVKSGKITDSDRVFNIIAVTISQKVKEIGIELGLSDKVLTDELETGKLAMEQGSKKAMKMFQLWQQSVNEDKLTYSVLATALENQGFTNTADKFCYTSSILTDLREGNCEETTNRSGDVVEVFRCPCGQCKFESYLYNGCRELTKISYPYLDLSKLEDSDKIDLTSKLFHDIKVIQKSFGDLLFETCESLDNRGIDVHKLVRHALLLGVCESSSNPPLLKEDEKDLLMTQSMTVAFVILKRYMSFFNFDLLKHITENQKLCTDDDRKRMEDYCIEFKKFCGRKVFEVPPAAFGATTSIAKCKRTIFAVLMSKHDISAMKLIDVNEAIDKIAELLELKRSTLYLHRIDEGSLILVFSIPTFVARKLFPLTPSMKAKLKAEGLLLLIPSTIEETKKDHSKKVRRFSWPRGRNERKETSQVVKAFSQDSLYVKGYSNTYLLLFSAERGHSTIVKALVDGATSQEFLYAQWNGMTALMLASKYGHTDTVKVLIAAGAQAVLDIEYNGVTALMLAAKAGHTETVQALIEAGSIVTSKKSRGGRTALMMAAEGGHNETVKTLIAAGADVSLKEKGGMTALMMAAKGSHKETVKSLIAAGADVSLKDYNGLTALMRAAESGHDEIVQTLIAAGADLNIKSKWIILRNGGRTALMLAAEGGHKETVKTLVAAGADVSLKDNNGWTALMMAAEGGHNGTVKTLIAADADLNIQSDEWSIFRYGGRTTLMLAAKGGYNETVKILIAAGTDFTLKDDRGWTALMRAAEGGHNETVQTLIAAGADLNIQSFMRNDGRTALMLAAEGGYNETVKILIAAGADVSLKDNNGWTALMMAAEGGHNETVQTLIAAGADLNIQSFMWNTLRKSGMTALMMAAEGGYRETVKTLIVAGADATLKDECGRTALMRAAEGGHNETVQTLIAAGVDLNIQSRNIFSGMTALMMAAEAGYNETVKTLIAAGADISLKDYVGWTALMIAANGAHNETVQTLIAADATLDLEDTADLSFDTEAYFKIPVPGTGQGTSDELFYFKSTSFGGGSRPGSLAGSRAGSLAESSAGSHCSIR